MIYTGIVRTRKKMNPWDNTALQGHRFSWNSKIGIFGRRSTDKSSKVCQKYRNGIQTHPNRLNCPAIKGQD